MRYQCDGCEEIMDESDLDRDEMGEILCPICGNDELTELDNNNIESRDAE